MCFSFSWALKGEIIWSQTSVELQLSFDEIIVAQDFIESESRLRVFCSVVLSNTGSLKCCHARALGWRLKMSVHKQTEMLISHYDVTGFTLLRLEMSPSYAVLCWRVFKLDVCDIPHATQEFGEGYLYLFFPSSFQFFKEVASGMGHDRTCSHACWRGKRDIMNEATTEASGDVGNVEYGVCVVTWILCC